MFYVFVCHSCAWPCTKYNVQLFNSDLGINQSKRFGCAPFWIGPSNVNQCVWRDYFACVCFWFTLSACKTSACHMLLETSQKVARNFSKSCSKVAKKSKTFFFLSLLLLGLMQNYAICTTKVTFLSIFVQFCIVTSVVKKICSQYVWLNSTHQCQIL